METIVDNTVYTMVHRHTHLAFCHCKFHCTAMPTNICQISRKISILYLIFCIHNVIFMRAHLWKYGFPWYVTEIHVNVSKQNSSFSHTHARAHTHQSGGILEAEDLWSANLNFFKISLKTRTEYPKTLPRGSTIDLEIFGVKIFSSFALVTKIKNTKIYLQWQNDDRTNKN